MAAVASLKKILFYQSKSTFVVSRPCLQHLLQRNFTDTTDDEQRIANIIKENLNVHDISVQDISGGCGAMYEVFVSSSDFKGKRMIQQHRLINEILKEEVKDMHGLRIQTEIPKETS